MDKVVWTLDMSKIFSTKSTHYCLNQRGHSQSGRLIWKSKLPLEINIFLYQAFRNKLQCATSMRKSDPQLLHIQYTLNFLSHIFFECCMSILWHCIREAYGWDRFPTSTHDFLSNRLPRRLGVLQRVCFFFFACLIWAI